MPAVAHDFVQVPTSRELFAGIRHDELALGATETFTWKKKKKKSVEFGLKFGSSLLSYITQPKSVTSGNAPAT